MTALDRKLLRDLAGMKGQALAIALVIACGVATFVMSLSTLESLARTQRVYYTGYRFAHVFAQLKRAPNLLAARIAEIPGVAQVQTRIVVDVTLDVAELPEPAVGRLISLPPRGRPALNDLYLRRGRFPERDRRGEVLVSEGFAEAHGLAPGDSVLAVVNERRQRLRIVGVALSPEYIYQIREGELLPDDRRFGVFWTGYDELAAAFDMDGAFNNVTLSLMRGASEPEVLMRLDRMIEPYGGVGAYGRDDHLSHRFVSDEIEQLRAMAVVLPTIFLGVAAFLLNVVLSRLIGLEREQIAALKAFGYTRREIGLHYVKLVALIVLGGGAVGTAAGAMLGRDLTRLYTRFFRFPVFEYDLQPEVVLLAVLVSAGAALLGTLNAVRRAVLLPPAEAMRPEPPPTFRPTVVERLGLAELFSPAARMILRQLERRPVKAALSTLGIAMAAAILVLGNFSEDAINHLMEFEFEVSQRQDMTIHFVEPTSGRALHEIRRLPGVLHAEPFRTVPVRLRSGHHARRVAIQGLPPGGTLNPLYSVDDPGGDPGLRAGPAPTPGGLRPVALPDDGLVLSEKLAELLEVGTGDAVIVEVLEGERPIRTVPVAATVSEYMGTNAYMDIRAVRRLLREGPTVSGAWLTVDPLRRFELYTRLKNTPRVAVVTIKEAAVESFQETVAENLLRMRAFNVLFATIIAFGVVYNTARISLSERSRELATLRVIGFTRGEISLILLGELCVLTLMAVPLGLAIGYGFAAVMIQAFETEMFRIPLVVAPRTFAFAAIVVTVASLLSGLVVRRRLDRLDLVSVLKSKE